MTKNEARTRLMHTEVKTGHSLGGVPAKSYCFNFHCNNCNQWRSILLTEFIGADNVEGNPEDLALKDYAETHECSEKPSERPG